MSRRRHLGHICAVDLTTHDNATLRDRCWCMKQEERVVTVQKYLNKKRLCARSFLVLAVVINSLDWMFFINGDKIKSVCVPAVFWLVINYLGCDVFINGGHSLVDMTPSSSNSALAVGAV